MDKMPLHSIADSSRLRDLDIFWSCDPWVCQAYVKGWSLINPSISYAVRALSREHALGSPNSNRAVPLTAVALRLHSNRAAAARWLVNEVCARTSFDPNSSLRAGSFVEIAGISVQLPFHPSLLYRQRSQLARDLRLFGNSVEELAALHVGYAHACEVENLETAVFSVELECFAEFLCETFRTKAEPNWTWDRIAVAFQFERLSAMELVKTTSATYFSWLASVYKISRLELRRPVPAVDRQHQSLISTQSARLQALPKFDEWRAAVLAVLNAPTVTTRQRSADGATSDRRQSPPKRGERR